MALKIIATGNAGVFLQNSGGCIYIDSFFHPVPDVGGRPSLRGADAAKADVILVTHNHYDHLHPEETRDAALASGAVIAGPAKVIHVMAKHLPAERLVTLEAPERQQPPATYRTQIGDIVITAFRTYHGQGHNSYLIEMGGVRIFHDADNERTQPLDVPALGTIDLLLLCPWAGSGAGEFVQKLNPRKWLLIHMTDEEIDQHLAGTFLPALLSPVPPGVVALRGGEVLEI
ncbi:MAG: MBL fold metallo-hydrolase [Planctomycetaceae bacterium]|nr:MBL fold metallo-hydrolase [Planctomycetaceae bacterium]